MKKLLALIALLVGLGFVQGATAGTECSVSGTRTSTLAVILPNDNTDGSVLTDLAGLRVYFGTEAGNYTTKVDAPLINPVGGGTWSDIISHDVAPNASVTYYYGVTAYTTEGLESEYSTMGSKTFFGQKVFVIPCPPLLSVVEPST